MSNERHNAGSHIFVLLLQSEMSELYFPPGVIETHTSRQWLTKNERRTFLAGLRTLRQRSWSQRQRIQEVSKCFCICVFVAYLRLQTPGSGNGHHRRPPLDPTRSDSPPPAGAAEPRTPRAARSLRPSLRWAARYLHLRFHSINNVAVIIFWIYILNSCWL